MAEILETQNNKEKSTLATVADVLGGLEIASDVASLSPDPYIGTGGSIASGTLGAGRELLNYFDGTQSGDATIANMVNHAIWTAAGIFGAKGLKLASKAGKLVNLGSSSAKNSNKLLNRWIEAEKELNAAKKNYKWGRAPKALQEKVNLAKLAYENSRAVLLDATAVSRFIIPKTIARKVASGVGRTATAGALTYGVPGTEQFAVENDAKMLAPKSMWYGTRNGFELLGKDFKNAWEGDLDATARLTGVFIKPHGSTVRKGSSVMKNTRKPSKPKRTTKQLAKPKKNFNGGKLEIIKELRNETNT